MRVTLERLTKHYGAVRAVDGVDLDIADGEFLVLLGPSGCGKTTTMRSIVGLEEPSAGLIKVGDSVVFEGTSGVNVPPNKRRMGMVFQSYAIWPHKTVFENVAYPLEQQRMSGADVRQRVERVLDLVGLTELASRGASLLSGGQMQRVALARSVVAEPRVLLLDEPLSNLDAKLRDHLRFELRQIQQRLGITAIYVTHDQTEALALADRIAVMRDGRIVQLGTPREIYERPVDTFVADFLGVSNILPGEVKGKLDGHTQVQLSPTLALLSAFPAQKNAQTHVCIRPEHVRIAADDSAKKGASDASEGIPATLEAVNYLGSHVRYLLRCDDGVNLFASSQDVQTIYRPGDAVRAYVSPAHVQLLES